MTSNVRPEAKAVLFCIDDVPCPARPVATGPVSTATTGRSRAGVELSAGAGARVPFWDRTVGYSSFTDSETWNTIGTPRDGRASNAWFCRQQGLEEALCQCPPVISPQSRLLSR